MTGFLAIVVLPLLTVKGGEFVDFTRDIIVMMTAPLVVSPTCCETSDCSRFKIEGNIND